MITRRVSLRVVDLLETVDVQEDHGDPLAAAATEPVDLALECREPGAPPERPGQVIGGRDLDELLRVGGHCAKPIKSRAQMRPRRALRAPRV